MELLDVTMRLGLPPLDDSKLRAHISLQSGLLGEVVPLRLSLTEKPGFGPATGSKILKRRPVSKHENTRIIKGGEQGEYPARRNDDFAQGSIGLVQGIDHGREPNVKVLPLHTLGNIIKQEQS